MTGDAGDTLVLRHQRDADGISWRGVTLHPDGVLEVSGQDLGQAVEDHWGSREYEFSRRLAPAEVDRLRVLLGLGPRDDLLAAIGSTFAESDALEEFLVHHDLAGSFWSRTGD